jgi:hypothetical protein
MTRSQSNAVWWLSGIIAVLVGVLAFQTYITRVRRAALIQQDVNIARATAYLLRHGETGLVSTVYSSIEDAGAAAPSWCEWRNVRETTWGQLGMREHFLKTTSTEDAEQDESSVRQ